MLVDDDKITPKYIKLIDCQIEIVLKALELYAFNLHNTWGVEVNSEENERRNANLFYTYNSILEQKTDYKISYDFIREYKLEKEYKKKKVYYATKNKYKKLA